jgi:hypothetical protein
MAHAFNLLFGAINVDVDLAEQIAMHIKENELQDVRFTKIKEKLEELFLKQGDQSKYPNLARAING